MRVLLAITLLSTLSGAEALAAPSHGIDQTTRKLAAQFLRLHRSTPRRLRAARRNARPDGWVSLGRMETHHTNVEHARKKLAATITAMRIGYPADNYAVRASAIAGIPQETLDAYIAVQQSRVRPGSHVLRTVELGLDPAQCQLESRDAELVRATYGVNYWRGVGDKSLALAATRRVRRRARKLRVDPAALLAEPVVLRGGFPSVRVVPRAEVAGVRGKPLDDRTPVSEIDFSPTGPHQWWTGTSAGLLDLALRGLPQLLSELYEQGAKRLRVWHAGFEDTSQTFLIAAMLDEAIARKGKKSPGLVPFLDQLKLEIVASDHLQRPKHHGRRFRFNDAEKVQFQAKAQLLLRERGAMFAAEARKHIGALERNLALDTLAPGSKEHQQGLHRLLRAGKLADIMGHVLQVNPHLGLHKGMVSFAYDLKPNSWRVDDTINKSTLNAAVKNRHIRFVRSDLTQQSAVPRGTADLVVVTNVLPYLSTYGGDEKMLPQAASNLHRGRASHAPVVMESGSATVLGSRAARLTPAILAWPAWVMRGNNPVEETTIEGFANRWR